MPITQRRSIALRFDVTFRRDRNHWCSGGEGFVQGPLSARRDHQVRREDVVLQIRQEAVRVHARLRLRLQLWTAYDDHRDIVHRQGTEGLHRLPNEIFPDRGTADGHEDRLLPEEQVFPKLFSRRAERADDRLDPPDVRPRWGVIEGEDQIDLSGESGEPKVPVPLEQAGGRVLRKVVAQSVEDDRRGNSVADGLPHGGDFAGGEEKSIRLPIGLPLQILPGDPQVSGIVDIPSPDRQQSTVDRRPIRRRRRRHGIEPARDHEVQSGHAREEQEIQIFPTFAQAAGEGDRLGRVPESLGVNREVSLDLTHRARAWSGSGKTFGQRSERSRSRAETPPSRSPASAF